MPKTFHSSTPRENKHKTYFIYYFWKPEFQNKLYRGSGTNPLPIRAIGEKAKNETVAKLKSDSRLEDIQVTEV